MTKTNKIILTVSSTLVLGLILIYFTRNVRKKKRMEKFWEKAIYGVVAHEGGKSKVGGSGKKYTDLIDLDGGTVGICHFASGGLCSLYSAMNTEKYFNRSKKEMCDKWASKQSGAYDQKWWRDGFRKFLNNSKNNKLQIDVCRKSRQQSVDEAIKNGWKTDRQLAIAVGVSNSYGNSGFVKKAKERNWDSERILKEYVYKFGQNDFSSHKDRRRKMIDKWFPKNKEKNIV